MLAAADSGREELERDVDNGQVCVSRLEQGRDNSPSAQVLEAVAQALKLNADAADHNRLCLTLSQRPRDRGEADVSPQVLQLMDGWEHTPAFVLGLPSTSSRQLPRHGAAQGIRRRRQPRAPCVRRPGGARVLRGQERERAAYSCAAEPWAAYGDDPGSAASPR